jgi:hypothetical protein
VKTTQYFEYTRKRPDRSQIREEWIQSVIDRPVKVEIQSDGRIRKWARIPEADRYLRVILLEDGQTVHNAFFDRSYKLDSPKFSSPVEITRTRRATYVNLAK